MSAKQAALNLAEAATVRLAYYADRLDTYVQTKAGAARYREGAGKTPTAAELRHYRELGRQIRENKA